MRQPAKRAKSKTFMPFALAFGPRAALPSMIAACSFSLALLISYFLNSNIVAAAIGVVVAAWTIYVRVRPASGLAPPRRWLRLCVLTVIVLTLTVFVLPLRSSSWLILIVSGTVAAVACW